MALNSLGIGFAFLGRDLVSPVMLGIRKQFGLTEKSGKKLGATLGGGFVKLAAGVITTATAFKAFGGLVDIADKAGKYEQQLAAVGAVTRATAGELKMLEKSAIEAGIRTQFSPDQAIAGLRKLATMGYNAREATEALIPALDLAAGGQISIASAAQASASALKVFGLNVEDAALTTDKLLRITNMTALQAHDLELALGTIGRGAVIAKQSLDEMLPSMGLVKNTGVDASVAASSVSSALIFTAKRASKFKEIGVQVVDPVTGSFRKFLDIVQDVQKTLDTKYTDDATKAAKATELFGRFGLSAYSAITSQLNKGITDSTGRLLKNAEAVAYLRKEMANAGGAAAEFRKKLLETFEGQKTLLRGTLETMSRVFGKPFAKVFKPFVFALTESLNAVIRFFASLPEPAQKAIAGITVAVIALTAVLGIMLTAAGAITILLPYMKTLTIVLKAMSIAALKTFGVVGLFAAGISLAAWAIQNNIGGLGDQFMETVNKIKLFWKGLIDLFTKGGFSEEVSKELGKAGNKDIRQFAIRLYMLGYRLKLFFEYIGKGFSSTMKAMEPALGTLGEAVRNLNEMLSKLGIEMLGVAGTPSQNFENAGAGIGVIIAGLISGVVWLISGFIMLITYIMKVGYWFGDLIGKIEILRDEAFTKLIDTLKEVWEWFKKLVDIANNAIGNFIWKLIGGETAPPPSTAKSGGKPAPGRRPTQQTAAIPPTKLAPAGLPPAAQSATQAEMVQQLYATIAQTDSGASTKAIIELKRVLEKQPTIVSVNMDGERVAEAIASRERSRRARQGMPVGDDV